MLSTYLSNHQAQLLHISKAQCCPFTSVGYVKTLKKKLLEITWLTAKKNNTPQCFTQPDLTQLSALVTSKQSLDVISQACIEVMANLPQTINLAFINALLNSPSLHGLAKAVIYKVLLQQHSFNLIALIDLNTLYFALANSAEQEVTTAETVALISAFNPNANIKLLKHVFDELYKSGLVNSPLMSLFLLSLSWEQVNALSNYASHVLTVDDTLHVLLQSGYVKLVPLACMSLNQVENPTAIIALIRRMLGDKLDLLVSYDIQLSAFNAEQQALDAFKQQLQQNWPKYEEKLCVQRLVAGKALNHKLNAIEMSAMDCYSQAIFNLYTYYKSMAKNVKAEAQA
ncbi:hypothetical protein [Pseudoalteromonas sp. P1-25]|uniref:hypothetical protein n=1 Tax=Pseudoalteromonas sp. P1-25 TaxID=1723758 RepID=UPI0006D67F67|nr:hypothetical protein [Pseudoalteromonas sp. P1-25]KPZ53668.1 hypothetical protein AN393_02648 [Pseudoalteromonas sp. P1-25]